MPTPPTVTEFLHSAYRAAYEALTDCAQDESRTDGAPAFAAQAAVEQPEDAPASSEELLITAAGFVNASVGIRVRQHVGALALTYAALDPGPHWEGEAFGPYERWPGAAAFTLARSILEGVSAACWLIQEATDPRELMRRTALVELWSSWNHDQAGGQPQLMDDTRALVEGAGFRVVGKPGRAPGLEVPGRPADKFSHLGVIRAVFDSAGEALYRDWSGRAHHAPWAERGRLHVARQERESGSGLSFRSEMEEPAHVVLAANVVKIVSRYIDSLAWYYGRSRDGKDMRELAAFLQHQAKRAEVEFSPDARLRAE